MNGTVEVGARLVVVAATLVEVESEDHPLHEAATSKTARRTAARFMAPREADRTGVGFFADAGTTTGDGVARGANVHSIAILFRSLISGASLMSRVGSPVGPLTDPDDTCGRLTDWARGFADRDEPGVDESDIVNDFSMSEGHPVGFDPVPSETAIERSPDGEFKVLAASHRSVCIPSHA